MEEENHLVEQMNDEEVQDEGFDEEEIEDFIVPVLYDPSEMVPVSSSSLQACISASSTTFCPAVHIQPRPASTTAPC